MVVANSSLQVTSLGYRTIMDYLPYTLASSCKHSLNFLVQKSCVFPHGRLTKTGLIIFCYASGPWHMLRAPSSPYSFLSDWSEASGLNLSPPQSRLPGLPRPRPCPPVVRSRSLVCWPSSDASTFWAGTVCCPERPPHTAGTSSVQEPAMALPPLQAASRVHSETAWKLRRRTQVSTHGWGWSAPGEFYSLHTSQRV